MNKLELTGQGLETAEFAEATNNFEVTVGLSSDAKTRIIKCRSGLDSILMGDRVIYGINTGFGSLANIKIENDKLAELQRNLIRSHTAGTGELLPREIVRGAMILRLNTLALGFSGVRIEVAELLVDMLNASIIPQVPRFGSVGASGDLALLSAITLAMIEQTGSKFQPMVDMKISGGWKKLKSAEALEQKGLQPVTLKAKEGLALNNGCQVSNSISSLAFDMIFKAFKTSLFAAAISAQALDANTSPFDERVHKVRPHEGQLKIAKVMRNILKGSKLVDTKTTKVQDAYSIRCIPQVVGSAFDILNYSKKTSEIEMNSATDNPLLFDGENSTLDSISGGNFHGAPIAHACDTAVIATTDLASISERRIFRLITNKFSGLPSFLTNNPGVSSGLMITQYTAANLVSFCKSMSFPASVDSIPTCEGQEDHVSMAPVSAWKLFEVAKAFVSVTAIELLASCQAVEMRANILGIDVKDGLSKITKKVFNEVRNRVSFISEDEPLSPHTTNLEEMMLSSMLDFQDPLI